MLNWTTGTETPAPSFPRGREGPTQAVHPPQAPREGQEGPREGPQQGSSLSPLHGHHCLAWAPAAPSRQAGSQSLSGEVPTLPVATSRTEVPSFRLVGSTSSLKCLENKFVSTPRSLLRLLLTKMPPATLPARVPAALQQGPAALGLHHGLAGIAWVCSQRSHRVLTHGQASSVLHRAAPPPQNNENGSCLCKMLWEQQAAGAARAQGLTGRAQHPPG